MKRVVILGQNDSGRSARAMVEPALQHAASFLGEEIAVDWIGEGDAQCETIGTADGVFVAPGGPDEAGDLILGAIRVARVEGIPCLGTCGGFQKIVSEYAIHELGYQTVEHQELTPDAENPLFSELSCSLVGTESEVNLLPESLVASVYRRPKVTESFFCRYGINQSHRSRIEGKDLRISATDAHGEPRVIEHTNHPFFVGTLFVPQVRSTEVSPHPLILAFLRSVSQR